MPVLILITLFVIRILSEPSSALLSSFDMVKFNSFNTYKLEPSLLNVICLGPEPGGILIELIRLISAVVASNE